MQKSWPTFLYSLQGKWDIGAGIYWNVPTYLEIQKTEFVSLWQVWKSISSVTAFINQSINSSPGFSKDIQRYKGVLWPD